MALSSSIWVQAIEIHIPDLQLHEQRPLLLYEQQHVLPPAHPFVGQAVTSPSAALSSTKGFHTLWAEKNNCAQQWQQ
jgi:hypothetical protein